MKNLALALVSFLSLVAVAADPAPAASAAEKTADVKPLHVAVRSGEAGRTVFGYSEFGWRIIERLSKVRNLPVEQLKGPFSDSPEKLSSAGAEVLPAVFWLASVTNTYTPILQPLARATIELATTPAKIKTFDPLAPGRWPKVRVAYVSGILDTRHDFVRWAERNSVDATLEPYDDLSLVMEAVRTGRCDMALAAVCETPKGLLRVAEIRTRPTFLAVRNDLPAMHAALSRDLENLKLNDCTWLDKTWCDVFKKPVPPNLVRVAAYFEPGLLEQGALGEIHGYAVEYLSRLSVTCDWCLDYIFCTYPAALKAIEDGKADLVAGVTMTVDRQKKMSFSRFSAGLYQNFLYSKVLPPLSPDSGYTWEQVHIVKSPGAESRARLDDYLAQNHVEGAVISEFSTVEGAVSAYESGAADALYTVAYPGAKAEDVRATFTPVPWYFCVSKGRGDLLEQLDKSLMRIQSQLPGFKEVAMFGSAGAFPRAPLDLTVEEKAWLARHATNGVPVRVEMSPEVVLWKEWDVSHRCIFGVLKAYLDLLSIRTGLKFECLPPVGQSVARLRFLNGESDVWACYMADLTDLPSGCPRQTIFSNPTVCAVRRSLASIRPGEARFAVMACDTERRDALTRAGFGDRLVLCESEEECMQAVVDGRAEATLSASRSALVLMRRLDALDDVEIRNLPEFSRLEDVAFAFSPKADPVLASILRKAMDGVTPLDVEQMIHSVIYSRVGRVRFTAMQLVIIIASVVVLLLAVIIVIAFNIALRARRDAMEASAAGAAKSQFLSTISHEIRTPLNVLVGFANFLNQTNVTRAQIREYTDGIRLSSQVLLSLINDVLDLSKLEAGKMDISGQCVLPDLFAVLRVMFEGMAKQKGLQFDMFLQPGMPILSISAQRLRQVLFNLISNAIKYTEKGRVHVDAVGRIPESGQYVDLTIRVSDTGIGISRECAQAVFNPFEQDISRRGGKIFEGTGLGLAIVKRLVEAAGGEISLDSRVGVGSVFTVYLPRLGVIWPSELKGDSSYSIGSTAADIRPTATMRFEHDAGGEAVAAKPSPLIPEGAKLLIVDDVALNLRVFSIYLTKLGAENVLTATSGEKALDLAKREKPQFVFTDMWMPGMNGSELAEAIRQLPFGGSTKIIAVTADADSAATFRLDAFDTVMTKPVTEEKIVAAIKKAK